MILKPREPALETNGSVGHPRPSPTRPTSRRRRWRVLIGVAVLLGVGVLTLRVLDGRSQAPPVAVTPEAGPLVAHGQVAPARQARVGTVAGGVVQELTVSVGSDIDRQAVVAWVLGPTGTEIVTAPFRGTVSNILVHEGDTVSPSAALVVVADLHTLQVELSDVDEFLISHLQPGQDLSVTVDALDDIPVDGVVTTIALLPQLAASTGTTAYPVTLSLSGAPPELRAGMSVRVTLR